MSKTQKATIPTDKMGKAEACQLYIEQEIQDRLAQGMKPAKIGRELHEELRKLFETNIQARTLEQRARRVATTVAGAKKDPPVTVKLGKAKTDHGISKYITFYFCPGQDEAYEAVVKYLQVPGKRHRGHPHMDLQKLVDALAALLYVENRQGGEDDTRDLQQRD
jgi:hypothetical protein